MTKAKSDRIKRCQKVMNNKNKGDIGEITACAYLEENGYTVLKRNKRYAGAEIDIIAYAPSASGKESKFGRKRKSAKLRPAKTKKVNKFFLYCGGARRANNLNLITDGTIVFCEVKSRSGNQFGEGQEAVTKERVSRYILAAKTFLQRHRRFSGDIRFDVIVVEISYGVNAEIKSHIENAFDADCSYRKSRF